MLQITSDEQRLRAENVQLREQLGRLRAENSRLREDNRRLRGAVGAHVARAGSSALFGPLELTAGTCVGPRRQRHNPGTGAARDPRA